MAIIFWCKVLGFKNLDVVDIHPDKARQVEEFGGNLIFSDELAEPNKYDKVFETSGVVSNIEKTLSVANKGAKIVLIGQPSIGSSVTFENFLKYYDDITLIPSMGGQFDPDFDMPLIYKACSDNSKLVNKLVSNILMLDEINEGFQEMRSPTSRRIIIEFPEKSNE